MALERVDARFSGILVFLKKTREHLFYYAALMQPTSYFLRNQLRNALTYRLILLS